MSWIQVDKEKIKYTEDEKACLKELFKGYNISSMSYDEIIDTFGYCYTSRNSDITSFYTTFKAFNKFIVNLSEYDNYQSLYSYIKNNKAFLKQSHIFNHQDWVTYIEFDTVIAQGNILGSSAKTGNFAGCVNLQKVIIKNGIKLIAAECFFSCKQLKEVILPESLDTISEKAFLYCSSLSNINFPDALEWIDDYAFCYCDNLKVINIPKNVDTIGIRAFRSCNDLHTVNFASPSNTILKLLEGCFEDCMNLDQVNLPKQLSYLANCIFLGSRLGVSNSFELNYDGTAEEWKKVKKDSNWNAGGYADVVHCTDGNITIYKK